MRFIFSIENPFQIATCFQNSYNTVTDYSIPITGCQGLCGGNNGDFVGKIEQKTAFLKKIDGLWRESGLHKKAPLQLRSGAVL
jgi:hypothetical protein